MRPTCSACEKRSTLCEYALTTCPAEASHGSNGSSSQPVSTLRGSDSTAQSRLEASSPTPTDHNNTPRGSVNNTEPTSTRFGHEAVMADRLLPVLQPSYHELQPSATPAAMMATATATVTGDMRPALSDFGPSPSSNSDMISMLYGIDFGSNTDWLLDPQTNFLPMFNGIEPGMEAESAAGMLHNFFPSTNSQEPRHTVAQDYIFRAPTRLQRS